MWLWLTYFACWIVCWVKIPRSFHNFHNYRLTVCSATLHISVLLDRCLGLLHLLDRLNVLTKGIFLVMVNSDCPSPRRLASGYVCEVFPERTDVRREASRNRQLRAVKQVVSLSKSTSCGCLPPPPLTSGFSFQTSTCSDCPGSPWTFSTGQGHWASRMRGYSS